jgi:hypothetical protein
VVRVRGEAVGEGNGWAVGVAVRGSWWGMSLEHEISVRHTINNNIRHTINHNIRHTINHTINYTINHTINHPYRPRATIGCSHAWQTCRPAVQACIRPRLMKATLNDDRACPQQWQNKRQWHRTACAG